LRLGVDDVEQPAAYQEGYYGVYEGVGEDAPDGVLAQLGHGETGEPAGRVAQKVVGGHGDAGHLGEEDPFGALAADGAGAGGQGGGYEAAEGAHTEQVPAQGVKEHAAEEAKQNGLQVPQRGGDEDHGYQGQAGREEAEGQVGDDHGVEERGDGHDEGGAYDGGLLQGSP
jgi:hypothetical protein